MIKIIFALIIFILAIIIGPKLHSTFNYVLILINNISIETNLFFLLFSVIVLNIIIIIIVKIISLFFTQKKEKTNLVTPKTSSIEIIKQLIENSDFVKAESLAINELKKNLDPQILKILPLTVQDLSKSILALEKLLKKNKNNIGILNCIGAIYLKNKMWGQAISTLEKSISIDPSSLSYALLGEVFEKLSNKDEAYKFYRLCSNQIIK